MKKLKSTFSTLSRLSTTILIVASGAGAFYALDDGLFSLAWGRTAESLNPARADESVELLEVLAPEVPGLTPIETVGAVENVGTAQGAPADVSRGRPEPEVSAAPGSIAVLWTDGIPGAREYARRASRLGLPLVVSGLPVLARTPQAVEAAWERNDPKGASPFIVDRERTERLASVAVDEKALLAASPEIWHAVRDELESEPEAPALVLFGEETVEVFPGNVDPLWLLAWAAEHAQSAEIRALARERILRAGLEDEARRIKP